LLYIAVNYQEDIKINVKNVDFSGSFHLWKKIYDFSTVRGITRGGKGGAIPWAPNHYGRGAESLRGAPKTPNNVTSTFFNSRFASEKPPVRTWGFQTCFFARVPAKLITPLSTPIIGLIFS